MTNENYALTKITDCLATACLCFAITFVLLIVIYMEVNKHRETNSNTINEDTSAKVNDSKISSIAQPPTPVGMIDNYTDNETSI